MYDERRKTIMRSSRVVIDGDHDNPLYGTIESAFLTDDDLMYVVSLDEESRFYNEDLSICLRYFVTQEDNISIAI